MTTLTTDPEHIAVSKSRGIDIDWKDGHHSSFPLEYLRDWCPCATCTGSHGTEPRKKTTELPALIDYNLTRSGFQPRTFGGADGTLEALEVFQPDLIVLDVMLPGHDGFELCRRIRSGGKLARVPVVFLTARSDEVDRVLGL